VQRDPSTLSHPARGGIQYTRVATGSPLKTAFSTAHIHEGDSGEIDEIDGPVENDEKVLEAKIESGGILSFKDRQVFDSGVSERCV